MSRGSVWSRRSGVIYRRQGPVLIDPNGDGFTHIVTANNTPSFSIALPLEAQLSEIKIETETRHLSGTVYSTVYPNGSGLSTHATYDYAQTNTYPNTGLILCQQTGPNDTVHASSATISRPTPLGHRVSFSLFMARLLADNTINLSSNAKSVWTGAVDGRLTSLLFGVGGGSGYQAGSAVRVWWVP